MSYKIVVAVVEDRTIRTSFEICSMKDERNAKVCAHNVTAEIHEALRTGKLDVTEPEPEPEHYYITLEVKHEREVPCGEAEEYWHLNQCINPGEAVAAAKAIYEHLRDTIPGLVAQ